MPTRYNNGTGSRRWTAAVFAAGLGLGAAAALVLQTVITPASARLDPSQPAITPRTPLSGAYRAQVLKVIDGDTVEARIHVWMGQEIVTRVRLAGIDAPEMNGACAAETDLARRARNRLMDLIGTSPVLLAEVRPDKYFGRVAARLVLGDGRDAGEVLGAEALARFGSRRFSWC
jgi:micrococcal nuclease